MSRLVIFGTAEIAALARFYFDHDSEHRVEAFTVDDDFVEEDTYEGLPVVPFSEVAERYPAGEHAMHVALSYRRLNRLREEKYRQAKAAGYELVSYVCTRSALWPDLAIGDNCLILENQTIQPTVRIGANVMLWSGNHVGHGTAIEDHVYVASHVCISGHCRIGARSFVGVNATIRDFTAVGADCVIGMDASVAKDVPDGAVVVGPSSTVLPGDDRRARVLKRRTFGA